jgi:peroxiredoxin Q/BCP
MAKTQTMEGTGSVVLKKANNFNILDSEGKPFEFFDVLKKGPVLMAFYPGDFTFVCTKQLCNYRDNWSDFQDLGIQVIGISPNPWQQHAKFTEQYKFPFPLLSDPGNAVAKNYGCTSLFLLGGVSRTTMVVNQSGLILYRYVEPTTFTHRKADELIGILRDLRTHNLV